MRKFNPHLRILNPRVQIGLSGAVVLALAWFSFGDRLVTHFAWAVERGRIQASDQELSELQRGMPELNAVARAFKLVAKIARPGVVFIKVSGGEGNGLSEDEIQDLLRQHRQQLERQRKNGGEDENGETKPAPKDKAKKPPKDEDEDESTDPNEPSGKRQSPADRLKEQLDQLEQYFRNRRAMPASGSGFIIDTDGYIVTNNHVVGGRTDIRVKLYDNRDFTAKLIGTDPKSDLAVIKIDAPDLQPLKFGDSSAVEVGDWVIAVGSPFGLTQTVTHGIVSAVGRTRVPGINIQYQDFIQTDAAINPGNSGGPLLNIRGELVGVNTAIATGDGVNAGIAFTIPGNRAMKVAQQLKSHGKVVRGWIGISFTPVQPADAEILGLDGAGGVVVDGVVAGSPAAEAKLQVDDVIVQVNGDKIGGGEQWRDTVAEMTPHDVIRLRIIRDGAPQELSLTLGEQPEDMQAAARRGNVGQRIARLGFAVRTFRPAMREPPYDLKYEDDARGVVVMRLDAPPKSAKDIKAGELIVACRGQKVKTVRDLMAALKEAPAKGRIELEILQPDGDKRLLKWEPAAKDEEETSK